MEKLQAWTLKQLHVQKGEDLKLCNTDFERSNVEAFARMDIKKNALEFLKTRKLTPGEVAILEMYGITI